jgi:uncharacterized protein YukE
MADNQMVKIVFDFDLGNVPASAKKLSQYLKDNNLDLKFTKQSVDAATASLKQFATAQNAAGAAAATTGNQLKKSNMQWTNLALVIQDLPYGFRGIQNNLPALIGGFAGMSGAIYLAGSAIIAFFTAYNMGLFDSISTTNKFEAANKKAIESVSQEATKVALLVAQYKSSNTSALERKEIIKELNSINPQYFGNLDKEKTSVSALNDSYLAYIGNLGNVIKAKKLEEQLTKNIEERLKYETEAGIALLKSGYRNPELINQQNAALKKYNGMLQKEADLAERITNLSKVAVPTKTGGAQAKLEDPTIKLLQAKQKYYKDDLLMFASYEEEILGRERDLAVKRAEMEGQSDEYIKTIKDTYNQLILNSQAETGRKFIEEQHKLGQEEAKEHEKVAQMILATRNKLAAAINSINEQFANKRIKEVDAELAATLRGTKGNYQAQVNAIQGAIDKLEEEAAAAAEAGQSTAAFEDKIASLKRTMEGLIDPLEQLEMNINKTFNDLATGALVELGKQIGNVFSGSSFSLNGFLSMLGDGLIQLGTYLVSISTVFLGIKKLFETGGAFAGLAIPIGLAAIATGMVIKNKLVKDNTPKFANGGIVSGPTMGLMGEYPGAQSNPEVIAPLDKLKSMIGGGGNGEFVLRGNDLVLALQRSNSSLNLRRGGI